MCPKNDNGFKNFNLPIDFKMNEVIQLENINVGWVEPGFKTNTNMKNIKLSFTNFWDGFIPTKNFFYLSLKTNSKCRNFDSTRC